MKLDILKPTFWKVIFYVLSLMGLYALTYRFIYGLGAASAMNDLFPWGLWTGFNKLGGIGLAAGGFVICATVHIFNIEKYKPIIRPTVLIAFLGYLFFAIALIMDLGLPWRIWHPIVMWNPHSVMFEVAWCVMLYMTVLLLEFSPVIFEKLKMAKVQKIMHNITIPIVIIGVILSTLHQSSLGSLYLIVPTKLHPFWYSPMLPIFFFISSVGAGLAMIIFASFLSYRAFGKELRFDILNGVAKVAVVVYAFYLVAKIEDYNSLHVWKYFLEPGYEKYALITEIMLGAVLPMIMLFFRKVRASRFWMFISSLSAILGFMANRINVTITGMRVEGVSGLAYFPHVFEIIISLFLFACGFVLFALAVKYLSVYSDDKPSLEKV